MNKLWKRNILRITFILILQLVLLKRVNLTFGGFNYVHLTIYALTIALLPYKLPRPLIIVIGFFLGLTIDIFYDSIGVHAGATTMIAYLRYYVLAAIAPKEGYKKQGLTAFEYGVPWFLSYFSILLFIHLATLYSLEAFSFVYFSEIALRTIFSFVASLFICMVGILIFNPKY